VKDGVIEDIKFFGDFLAHGDLNEIEEKLKKVRYDEYDIVNALSQIDLGHYFGSIEKKEFAKFLYV